MSNRWAPLTLALAAVSLTSAHAACAQSSEAGVAKTQKAAAPTDLSGVWRRSRKPPDNTRKYTIYELALSLSNEKPEMTPWGVAKFRANKPNLGPNAVSLSETNDPIMKCFPPGVPRVYLIRAEPLEIMQVPGRVVMLFEYDHFVREIFMDRREHPKDLPGTWMGDAIGRWEGDTLVVDTAGFNDKTWLDNEGRPHSEELHVIERIRRVNHDTITIDTTIEDPKAYTKPWVGHAVYELKPDWTLGEMICQDNVTFDEMQKKSEGK